MGQLHRKIKPDDLAFDIQKISRNRSYSASRTATDATLFTLTCGENVAIQAIAQGDDGKAYNANYLSKPAIGIGIDTATMGSIVRIKTGLMVTIPGAAFAPNSNVFLTSPGVGVPNLTTTPPAAVAGRICQILGKSAGTAETTTNVMIINIEEPYWFG